MFLYTGSCAHLDKTQLLWDFKLLSYTGFGDAKLRA